MGLSTGLLDVTTEEGGSADSALGMFIRTGVQILLGIPWTILLAQVIPMFSFLISISSSEVLSNSSFDDRTSHSRTTVL